MEGLTEPDRGKTEEPGGQRNVVTLGWVAFFGGMAQDMIQPILPLFYTQALGLSGEFIGLIEGALTTVVSMMKVAAGYLSDTLRVRKPIVFTGYTLSAVGRFMLGFASTGAGVFSLRLMDGFGKGIKDAPRDALVAGSAGSGRLGHAFGIQRALDTLGSVAGPLLTWWMLRAWMDNPFRYQRVFWIAGIIAMVPLLLIGLYVKERSSRQAGGSVARVKLPSSFMWFLGLSALFALGNSSDAFIILRAKSTGMPSEIIPVAYAVMNLVSMGTAIPFGRLADRIGRRRMIACGWFVYALVYFGFAIVRTPLMMWLLYATYGLFYSLTEGSAKALVAELVGEENRGKAYGLYNLSVGVLALPASVIAGILWSRVSAGAPFLFGGGIALLSLAGLALLSFSAIGRGPEHHESVAGSQDKPPFDRK